MTTCRRHDDCPERVCRLCRREHVTHDGRGSDRTCATCLGDTRDNLGQCGELITYMFGEALVQGIHSQAAVLAGPTGDPEIWERRAFLIAKAATYAEAHTMAADALDALIEDNRDEPHPGWILKKWHGRVREHLGQGDDERRTLRDLQRYLDSHLTRLAHDPEFAFEEMHSELKRCRSHCETVLHQGEQTELGVTCPRCEKKRLVKVYDTHGDHWRCDCGHRLEDDQHRERLEADHIANAEHLPLSTLATRIGVPFTTLCNWSKPTRHVTRAEGVYFTPAKLKPVGKIDNTNIYAVRHAERLRDAR